MATDFRVFPNSYEGTSGQDLSFSSWFMDENPTLGPPPLPLNMEPSYADVPNHHLEPVINVSDPDDPLSDPVIWAFFNEPADATDDPSMPSGEGCSRENPVHPMQGSEVSVPTSQYTCICCQTLREIIHFNGINVKRLEIHGRFGIISHVILTKYDFDSSVPSQENQFIDFSKKGTQSVKKFLVQYFDSCGEEGYFLLEDPLSPFYDALSVGLLESNGSDDYLLSSPDHPGDYMKKQQEKSKQPDDAGSRRCTKIPLAKQRERTRNLKMKDLKDYFDLPMEDAARKMNVCPTVIKKICRKSGVERWPHRKIKSIEGKISKKLKKLNSNDVEEREQARWDIDKYKQELAKIYQQYSVEITSKAPLSSSRLM